MIHATQERNHVYSIIELFNPIYDVDKKTLKYDMNFLKYASINIPNDFEESTLLIYSGALLQLVDHGVQDKYLKKKNKK